MLIQDRQSTLMTLEELQAILPADSGGSKPSLRWISNEARRLKCYRRIGKVACIPAEAWPYFRKGKVWPEASE